MTSSAPSAPSGPIPFNVSRITERLIVGGGIAGADELAWLAQQGVTHVISAANGLNDSALGGASQSGLGFLYIPWDDDGLVKPVPDFWTAFAWVAAAEAQLAVLGKQVGLYVHCAAGVNRGPLMATFILAALSGLPGDEAWKIVHGGRPQAAAFNNANYRQSCLSALEPLRPFRGAPNAEPPAPASAPVASQEEAPDAEPVAPVEPVATAVAIGDAAEGETAGEAPAGRKPR